MMELLLKLILQNTSFFLGSILLLLILTAAHISRRKNRKVNEYMASLPGPIAIPFLGSLHSILGTASDNLKDSLHAVYSKYPPTARLWAPLRLPYILTADREILNALLGSSHNTHKTADYDLFKESSKGIFSVNGPDWRKIRKTINPSFRWDVLASFGSTFSYHTKVFLQKLQLYADNGEYVDIFVPIHLATMDFVCENMLGCRMDIQKRNITQLSTDMIKGSAMIFDRTFSVLYWSDVVYYLSGNLSAMRKAFSAQRKLGQEILDTKLKQRNERRSQNHEPANNIQTLMEIFLSNIETGDMSKQHALEEIVDTLVAGSLTTATTNAWVLKILAMRPDIQDKVYNEILETVGQREVTLQDISKLVYLDMVVKETLRHFSVPVMAREIVEDLQVDEKTTIPEGIQVLMFMFELHHNPKYWALPGEFYPEHFSSEAESSRPKGCFIPFLSGPRSCPGNKYGLQSIKILLANTILNFEFSTDEKMGKDLREEKYRTIYMLHPKSGFQVRVKRRSGCTGMGLDTLAD